MPRPPRWPPRSPADREEVNQNLRFKVGITLFWLAVLVLPAICGVPEASCKMQAYVCDRVRRWLWRKHNCRRAAFKHYNDETLYAKYGLWKLPTWAAWKQASAKG